MIATVNVLGVAVSAVNMTSAAAEIGRWIDANERHYVCVSGVHGVMECQRNAVLRDIHNRAGLVLPDGMPLAWWVRGAGNPSADRVCGPEFMPYLLGKNTNHRHFFYGASQSTLDQLIENVSREYPNARIAGAHSPPFRTMTAREDADIVAEINDSGADIVWVGLSTPKQERWMAAHCGVLNAAALIGVGAAFDMQAGNVKRAPKFIRRTGFEWAYRLLLEPKRLWRRYLTNNPLFVLLAVGQLTGLAKYSAGR